MQRYFALALLLASLLVLAVDRSAEAASPVLTKIRVTDMHCESCAQRIRRKLFSVPGVVNVRTVVQTDVAIVVPQRNRQPSPRAMWEAVEKAGFKIVQLEGPSGTFNTKPRR